jgi:PIN domain nuclease of toxin-antitoxin system
VSLLLDTHVFLWWLQGDPLRPEVEARIADPSTLVAVSAASLWEIAIKRALGKLRFEGSLDDQLSPSGFQPLAVSTRHAEVAGGLPPHHRDPFDRMLVAQAQLERFTLVARDRVFRLYDVELLEC